MLCPAAIHRLIEIGLPATFEYRHEEETHQNSKKKDQGSESILVAQIIHGFVTLIDSLRLGLAAVDHIHPIMSDLLRNINKYPERSSEYKGKAVIKTWLISLNKRKASESLSEEEVRQIAFDIEQAHDEFYHMISND